MYTDDSQATPTAQKYRCYGLMMDGAIRSISTIKGLYEEFEKWVWVNSTHGDLLGLNYGNNIAYIFFSLR